jgi:arylsulfatase A-like enzyme
MRQQGKCNRYSRLDSAITRLRVAALVALSLACAELGVRSALPVAAQQGQSQAQIDRTVLPVREPNYPPITELDVRKAKAPPVFDVKAPKGAPNVVLVLIDDMGFGQPSTFGGGIAMPTLDQLAAGGLRYNNFHTAALCSPTRAALLTGRNHHSNNTGAVQDIATAFPGNTGKRPNSIAPLAEILRLNGYNTGAFGKWHLTPLWETTNSGPFTLWPTNSGFEKFYGFLGGEANQWAPLLYDGTYKVEIPDDPNYYLTTDLANQAIGWMQSQHSLTPDKPFFMYFAPGATHAPHHVPKQWADKYKGKFDEGWDKYREETLARQIKLGIVPAGTRLAPKPAAIKDWNTLSADERKLFARQMEVYAGFGEEVDSEVGRLVQTLKDLGEYDNTMFIYIAGDNGASAEGQMAGMFNEMSFFNGVPEALPDVVSKLDKWGGPETFPHYAAGWAVAGDTPYAYAKQVASDFGGTADGMVISWPNGFKDRGGIRSQFHHVIDIAPTVLEAAGLPMPTSVNGTSQRPMEGTSLFYTFGDAKAKDRHTTQYFEILGNRAIYNDGWLARTIHRAPWEVEPRATLDKDKWELYERNSDFSLANDVAAKYPEKLKELQALFMTEGAKYDVFPIDDRGTERLIPAIAGRPDLMGGRKSLTLFEGMAGIGENAFINVKNISHTITAEVELPPGGANGVVLAQAGRFGGWSLYFKDGKPAYAYNFIGRKVTTISGGQALPAGKATIVLDFVYDGGGRGKGATVTISVNGQRVAEGRIENTNPNLFSADEGADVGMDEGTPVTEDYKDHQNKFTGKILKVTIDTSPPKLNAKDRKAREQTRRNTARIVE